MKPCPAPIPSCRHCRHYVPEGRRGGSCQMLNVDVQSGWKACALAIPPFSTDWQFDGMVTWQTPLSPALHPVPDAEVVTEIAAVTARRRLAIPEGATAMPEIATKRLEKV